MSRVIEQQYREILIKRPDELPETERKLLKFNSGLGKMYKIRWGVKDDKKIHTLRGMEICD